MDKKKLIGLLLDEGDFKWEERPVLVSNNRGAECIFFPSDLYVYIATSGQEEIYPKEIVKIKARQAIAAMPPMLDAEVFNALRHVPINIPEAKIEDYCYLTIGLYLMLADAVSRQYDEYNPEKKDLTFLRVCYEEEFTLPTYTSIDDAKKSELAVKLQKVLERLGISSEFPELVRKWRDETRFDFLGIPNGQLRAAAKEGDVLKVDPDEVPEVSRPYTITNIFPAFQENPAREDIIFGPYAKLAKLVCLQETSLTWNVAVSYAMGNRARQINYTRPEEYLENVVRAIEGEKVINERIAQGVGRRVDMMIQAAIDCLGGMAIERKRDLSLLGPANEALLSMSDTIIAANKSQDEKREQCSQILEYFPENFLRIAHAKHYNYVYSQGTNISGVYPEGEIPGFTAQQVKDTRNSNGGNLSRYGFMAFSLGDRQDLKGTENEMRAAAQTAIHETMHRVFNDLMTEDERSALYQMVNGLKVSGGEKTSTLIPTNNYAEIIDPNSRLYRGYADAIKPEEVICNVYSLWHTEPNRDDSPLNTQKIQEFISAIEARVQAARDRLMTPKEVTTQMPANLSATRNSLGMDEGVA